MIEAISDHVSPPDSWFLFVSTWNKTRVRVGYTKALQDALGDNREEIISMLEKWSHFSVNSAPEWSQEKVDQLKNNLDHLFESSTGITLNSVFEKQKSLQDDFNATDNPLQTAIESGLTRIYRRDEE